MRQSHEIALAEIYQSRTATVVEWHNAMASNRVAASAFIKSDDNREEEIDPFEHIAAFYAIGAEWKMLDNSHYQYTLGFLPEEHWRRARAYMKSNLQSSLNRRYVDRGKYGMRDSFRAVVEEIERELAADEGN